MTTETKIAPMQIVDALHGLMTDLAQIEPYGARTVTRLSRQSAYSAIMARRAGGERTISDQSVYDPDAETRESYATEQARFLTDHLTAMVNHSNNSLQQKALVIATSLSQHMQSRLEELTGKKEKN